MPTELESIESNAELSESLRGLGGGPLAIDTEADSFHSYRERVCLVQLTFDGRDLIVDPLAGVDLQLLREPLADPDLRTILHGADYDLRLLDREFGLRVNGLFDTMVAARLLGERKFGLAALLERYFDVVLDKSLQRADWSRRPLTAPMLEYAAMDTRYLEALAGKLEARLIAAGRWTWAVEEFERLSEVRWNTERETIPGFRRVRGAARLGRRELALLDELWRVRDAEACRRDVAAFRVMRDSALLELVGEVPRDIRALEPLRELPRGWRTGRRATILLEAIERGLALPEAELPAREPGRGRRAPSEHDEQVKRLATRRDELAARLDLEGPLLAPRKTLEAIIAARVAGEDPSAVPEFRNWQAKLLLPLLE